MKASELIEELKQYPPDIRIMLHDRKGGFCPDPDIKPLDVIAITEWGSEKICDVSRKMEYDDCREFQILVLQ